MVGTLYGHGIGRALHEEPSVPSWDDGSIVAQHWRTVVVTSGHPLVLTR